MFLRSKRHFFIYLKVLILLAVLVPSNLYPQSQDNDPKMILIKIEDGFTAGDISEITPYLSSRTYISFSDGLNGYYSYSQSYNLLKDYFDVYKPIKFKFTSTVTDVNSPFGWGEYRYFKNGMRGEHKIFISLHYSDQKYKISQITIN